MLHHLRFLSIYIFLPSLTRSLTHSVYCHSPWHRRVTVRSPITATRGASLRTRSNLFRSPLEWRVCESTQLARWSQSQSHSHFILAFLSPLWYDPDFIFPLFLLLLLLPANDSSLLPLLLISFILRFYFFATFAMNALIFSSKCF